MKDFINDRIASEIVIGKETSSAELWVRHLLDECETVEGFRLETFLLNRILKEQDFELPDFITIVGHNTIVGRVIVETGFSNKRVY